MTEWPIRREIRVGIWSDDWAEPGPAPHGAGYKEVAASASEWKERLLWGKNRVLTNAATGVDLGAALVRGPAPPGAGYGYPLPVERGYRRGGEHVVLAHG
jgi:hypothetical protein